MMKMLLYGAAALMVTSSPVKAADIILSPSARAIIVTEEIGSNDFEAFKLSAGSLEGTWLVSLGGPGGNLSAALKIGEFIRLKGWSTLVLDKCYSSCALIWLAGVPRMMGPWAQIGFHAASFRGQEKGNGSALIGAYMNKLGLGYDAIFWATTAAPTEISYLTPDKARELGIDVEMFEVKQATAQPVAPPPNSAPISAPSPLIKMRDCSGIGLDLWNFFPQSFTDCDPKTRPKPFVFEFKYKTIRVWDRYIPSSKRFVTRTLQRCEDCRTEMLPPDRKRP